jgi:hypothetical protein
MYYIYIHIDTIQLPIFTSRSGSTHKTRDDGNASLRAIIRQDTKKERWPLIPRPAAGALASTAAATTAQRALLLSSVVAPRATKPWATMKLPFFFRKLMGLGSLSFFKVRHGLPLIKKKE